MAKCASRQDKANHVFLLASQVSKMSPSCPLVIFRIGPARKSFLFWPYDKSFIVPACLVEMAGYWPHSFFAFLLTSTSSLGQKKIEPG